MTDLRVVTEVIRKGEPLINFPDALAKISITRISCSSSVGEIQQNPENCRNFSMIQGLLYLSDNNGIRLCIPGANLQGTRVREMIIAQAHPSRISENPRIY